MNTPMLPRITVGVATYNRAAVLRQMLTCLVRQDYPPERLDLLVIDNNSPDNTREVAAEFETLSTAAPIATSPATAMSGQEAPPAHAQTHQTQAAHAIRYVHEPKQGLGHARNRAIAEARGDLLVLPDDDILMEPDWLRTLCAPLIAQWREEREDREGRKGHREIGCVAGEVVPVFPDGLPDWIREWHGPQGFRSAAEGPGPLPKTAYPMGANFAFPRWVFERLGVFSETLDRKGASFFGGGDREMLRRIHEADYAIWFVPAAKVLHQMPASRTTFRYAARHAFDSARSRVVERTRHGRGKRASSATYLVSRFFGNALKAVGCAFVALGWALLCRSGAAKKALVRAWRCCGYLYQIPRSLFGRI